MKISRFNVVALILAAMFVHCGAAAAQSNGNGETGECNTKNLARRFWINTKRC